MGDNIFLYGTLRHLDLLAVVAGTGDLALADATLPGYAVARAPGGAYPLIAPQPGTQAQGLLLMDIPSQSRARLDYYELAFGYRLAEVSVRTAQGAQSALAYFPPDSAQNGVAPWDLAAWVAQEGALSVQAAREVMARMHTTPIADLPDLFPAIRARAWAKLCATQQPTPATVRRQGASDVEMQLLGGGYDGFFRLQRFRLRHHRYDGSQTPWFARETFEVFDAALILPYDPATDEVLLIEQLRFGPLLRGDASPFVLEPVAGMVDAGESPADCARREAMEVAGLVLDALRAMPAIYPSPGYSTEFFHCFLALCDLRAPRRATTGAAGEHEDIRAHVVAFDLVLQLVDSGEINAGPLVMMVLWLARHRAELRASA